MRYRIEIDCPRTRRLNFHYVFDEKDALVYTARTVSEAVLWCIDSGETEILIGTESRFLVIECRDMVDRAPWDADTADRPTNIEV